MRVTAVARRGKIVRTRIISRKPPQPLVVENRAVINLVVKPRTKEMGIAMTSIITADVTGTVVIVVILRRSA